MDFELPEELRMLRETVARFVREELLPPPAPVPAPGMLPAADTVLAPSGWFSVAFSSPVCSERTTWP